MRDGGRRPGPPPIAGFTAAGAERQQAYEDAFTRGVSAEDIARTSRRLSDRPQLIGTPGVRRAQQISVDKLRSYGLDVSTPGYTVSPRGRSRSR